MGEMDRREFLKSSGAAAAATALATPAIAKGVRGANERIRVGLLGLGGRMTALVRALCEMKNDVEIVAICDCNQKTLDAVATPTRYADL